MIIRSITVSNGIYFKVYNNISFQAKSNFVQLQMRKSALRHDWPPKCDPDYTVEDTPMTLLSDIKEEHRLHMLEIKLVG